MLDVMVGFAGMVYVYVFQVMSCGVFCPGVGFEWVKTCTYNVKERFTKQNQSYSDVIAVTRVSIGSIERRKVCLIFEPRPCLCALSPSHHHLSKIPPDR